MEGRVMEGRASLSKIPPNWARRNTSPRAHERNGAGQGGASGEGSQAGRGFCRSEVCERAGQGIAGRGQGICSFARLLVTLCFSIASG